MISPTDSEEPKEEMSDVKFSDLNRAAFDEAVQAVMDQIGTNDEDSSDAAERAICTYLGIVSTHNAVPSGEAHAEIARVIMRETEDLLDDDFVAQIREAITLALDNAVRGEREKGWRIFWEAFSEHLNLSNEQRTYGWHDLIDAGKKGIAAIRARSR